MPTKRRQRIGASPPGRTGAKPTRGGKARPKRNGPTPGRQNLPIVKVELPNWPHLDPDLESLDRGLGELLHDAWPNYERAVTKGCRLKRRVAELLPKPGKPKAAAPPAIGIDIPQTDRTKLRPNDTVGYTIEPSAWRKMQLANDHDLADRLRSAARRQKAHTAINALFKFDLTTAKDRVRDLIDELILMAEATIGVRGLTPNIPLVSRLDCLRSFLPVIDRRDFHIAAAKTKPINSQDVIDDLQTCLQELRDHRVCHSYGLLKTAEQQQDLVDEPAWFKHSEGFTSVRWGTEKFTFTLKQAEAVRALWDAWCNGTPTLHQKTIAEKIDSNATHFRLRNLFWRSRRRAYHPAWENMITSPARGTYRIGEPANK